MKRLTPADAIVAVARVPMFSALGEGELLELLRACLVRYLPSGTQVISPRRKADSFYAILDGMVKVYKLSAGGDEQILHLYGPGQTFGEAAMWAGGAFPAYAETTSDAALLVVGRKTLRNLVASNAGLAMGIVAGLSAKLREFNLLIERLSLKDVPSRLASVLVDLLERSTNDTIRLGRTKRELASQIGTVPETLSRALKKLKLAGLINVAGAEITILDPVGLARLADG